MQLDSLTAAWVFIVNQVAMSGIILFTILGFITYAQNRHRGIKWYSAYFGLICLLIFLEVPLEIFAQTNYVFMVARISLLVIPFLAPLIGIGLMRWLNQGSRVRFSLSRIVAFLFVAFSTVLIVTSPLISTDNPDLRGFYSQDRKLFLESEIQTIDWSRDYCINTSVISDYYVSRYPWASIEIADNSSLMSSKGYLLLRENAITESHLIFLESKNYIGFYQATQTYGPIDKERFRSWAESATVILDTGSCIVAKDWSNLSLLQP